MKLPGQAEITHSGKRYHFYFGIDTTAEFLDMHHIHLAEFAKPFEANETKAMLDMYWCALLCGDTRKELPEGLTRDSFGRWLDECDEGAFAELFRAYTSSKPLGK